RAGGRRVGDRLGRRGQAAGVAVGRLPRSEGELRVQRLDDLLGPGALLAPRPHPPLVALLPPARARRARPEDYRQRPPPGDRAGDVARLIVQGRPYNDFRRVRTSRVVNVGSSRSRRDSSSLLTGHSTPSYSDRSGGGVKNPTVRPDGSVSSTKPAICRNFVAVASSRTNRITASGSSPPPL